MGESAVTDRLLEPIRRSFTLKLVVPLLVVAVVVGVLGGVIVAQTAASVESDTRETMEQAAVLQAETVAEWIDGTKRQTEELAGAEPVVEGEDEAVGAYLAHRRTGMDESVVAIHYVDVVDDRIVASSERGAAGTILGDEPWTRADLGLDGTSLVDPTEADPIAAFVAHVDDRHRVVVLADLEVVSERLDSPTKSDQSFTHVVSTDGTVVLSNDTDSIGTHDHHHADRQSEDDFDAPAGYLEIDMSGGSGEGMGGHDGGQHGDGHHGVLSMGYAHVDGADWIVMAHEPRSAAFALQGEVTRLVGALLLVAFLGFGLVGVLVGRNTSRTIGDLADCAGELERGNLEVDLESDREDEIGDLYDAFDRMRRALRRSIEDTNAQNRVVHELATELEATAEAYRAVMEQAAEGDLTVRADAESESEAMAEVGAAFNEMIADIEHAVYHVKQFADTVTEQSEEVTASSEEIERASEQVSDSIQEISRLTEDQHGRYETVLEQTEDLSAATEEIASLAGEVTDVAERTANAGDEGRAAANEAIEAMGEIDADVERTVAEIERLEERIEEIEEITTFIRTLANETNLLALNANIEASRANAGDDGFSVVAGEVKELSADVESAAEEIEGMIGEVLDQTDRTAAEVKAARREIDESTSTVEDALDALEEIARYADRTHDGTAEISAATQQQASAIQEVSTMVDESATTGEAVATAASEVAAAAQEQTAGLTEVVRSAESLATHARALQRNLETFEADSEWSQPLSAVDD